MIFFLLLKKVREIEQHETSPKKLYIICTFAHKICTAIENRIIANTWQQGGIENIFWGGVENKLKESLPIANISSFEF